MGPLDFDPNAYLASGSTGTSDFDPDAYLGTPARSLSFKEQASLIPKIASVVIPDIAKRMGPSALPIVGGAVGGVPGAALGEFGRQAVNTVVNPEANPKTALGRFASVVGASVMQEPKILNAIPGVPKVAQMASNLVAKTGRGMAKAVQAFSGGKAGDFIETAAKGAKTYTAPSLEKASAKYGAVLKKLPGEEVAPTMVEHITSAITPEASAGNKFLVDIGKKLDAGELINARQALKAKQSLDDVIDTVPIWQLQRRAKLFDLKRTFDEVLSNQSGPMKQASDTYRAAILKNNMTKFLPVNKHGEYSRLAPMLTGLASTVGGTVAGLEGGKKSGLIGALAPLASMVALSPGTLGLGAAGIGGVSRGLNVLGKNPVVRQALMQVLDKILQSKKAQ